MYVSPWMQAALLPDRWDVCGLIVPPMSVWHHYILRTVGSPYMIPQAETDSNAAAEVLMYAAQTHAQAAVMYRDAVARDKARKRIVAAVDRLQWPEVDAAVSEWVTECHRLPTHRRIVSSTKSDAPKSVPVKAPTEWVIMEYLTGKGMDMEAAWDHPWSAAVCLFDAWRDGAGMDSSLVDEEAERRLDEREAKREAVA